MYIHCYVLYGGYIQHVSGGKVNVLGGHNIGHSRKKVYMYMCPVPNGFRDRTISLYSSKISDKKETLSTISNTGTSEQHFLLRSSGASNQRGFYGICALSSLILYLVNL
jgi:hypothetical protein